MGEDNRQRNSLPRTQVVIYSGRKIAEETLIYKSGDVGIKVTIEEDRVSYWLCHIGCEILDWWQLNNGSVATIKNPIMGVGFAETAIERGPPYCKCTVILDVDAELVKKLEFLRNLNCLEK